MNPYEKLVGDIIDSAATRLGLEVTPSAFTATLLQDLFPELTADPVKYAERQAEISPIVQKYYVPKYNWNSQLTEIADKLADSIVASAREFIAPDVPLTSELVLSLASAGAPTAEAMRAEIARRQETDEITAEAASIMSIDEPGMFAKLVEAIEKRLKSD